MFVFLFSIQISFAANVESYDWGTGGDVTKNNLINKNIPKSVLSNKIISAAKKGTPIIKLGDRKGPKTLIVSGVHGSELSSQVAAMKIVNYLNKKKVKGTVYIIPFVAPKATSTNSRFFNGQNLNSIANKVGSPTNNIIKFSKNKGIQYIGDFHCTRPGGVPGKNIILGSKKPTIKSYYMAIAISKLTKHAYKIEYQAGKSYSGALEDISNLNKIPAVTCEVKMPHGKVDKLSVQSSYNQMLSLLKYTKNIT